MLMLLAIYGLRGGEVCRLRLEDFDWEHESIPRRIFQDRKDPNLSANAHPSVMPSCVTCKRFDHDRRIGNCSYH